MQHALIRLRRKPMTAVAIIGFTAIIALVLCGLNRGISDAQEHYDEIYTTIDVRCTVTNLSGDQSSQLFLSSSTIALFTGRSDGYPEDFPDDLSGWVENVQLTGSTKFIWNGEEYTLTGITSRGAKSALWPENGCTIFWDDGFDDAAFSGDRFFCLIPEALAKKLEEQGLSTEAFPLAIEARYSYEKSYSGDVEIAGLYKSEDTTTIYCPWDTYAEILKNMGTFASADSLSAVLRDNWKLEEFRELSSRWFMEPTPKAAGIEYMDGYYYALDINDSQLVQADTNLNNSMSVNRIAVITVFIMSTIAGALVGFLMIRNRKREIIIMRTVGTPDRQIYGSFAIEQLACVIPGVLAGGAYFLWNPISWLALFVGVYFVGLSTALLISLKKNLLTTIKEDE